MCRGRRREASSESRMQGNPHVRFDERDVETELWSSHLGTARRKGRKQTCPAYRHRATSRLYLPPYTIPLAPFFFSHKSNLNLGPFGPAWRIKDLEAGPTPGAGRDRHH